MIGNFARQRTWVHVLFIPPFAKSAKDGAPEHWLSGERKDRALMGLRPVFINPRTLVGTWGTRSELV
jgi:hypothetical protein